MLEVDRKRAREGAAVGLRVVLAVDALGPVDRLAARLRRRLDEQHEGLGPCRRDGLGDPDAILEKAVAPAVDLALGGLGGLGPSALGVVLRVEAEGDLAFEATLPLDLRRAALGPGDEVDVVGREPAALRVAERLARDGIEASVLDLRSLAPLDREALLAVARYCSRVLVVHEDSRTGGIGESLAAIVQEEAFESLDAPVRVVGALDTPVPYSPPLEAFFLPSEDDVEREARLLVDY